MRLITNQISNRIYDLQVRQKNKRSPTSLTRYTIFGSFLDSSAVLPGEDRTVFRQLSACDVSIEIGSI